MMRPIVSLTIDSPQCVSDLIDATSASWNEPLIRDTFFISRCIDHFGFAPVHWWLAQQSLPTYDVLEHHNMADTPNCTLCGSPDSWRHSLLECSMARCIWSLAKEEMVEHTVGTSEPDAKLWLFSMMQSLSRTEFTCMSVTLWAVSIAR